MRRRGNQAESPICHFVHRKEIAPECIWSVAASTDYSWPACWMVSQPNVLSLDDSAEWNAKAPAWIRFDLGPSAPCISRIELLPSMSAPGVAEHRIRIGMDVASMETVLIIGGNCSHRKWLECTLHQSRRTRFVEIHTLAAPKWTGWVRIRIWMEC